MIIKTTVTDEPVLIISAGKSGTVWISEDDQKNNDIRIFHKGEENIRESKRVTSEMLNLIATDMNDEYYAVCLDAGKSSVLCFDESGIGSSLVRMTQQSFSRDAVLVTTYADDFVSRGQCFQVIKRVALTSSQTRYVVFDLTAHTEKLIYSLPIQFYSSGGEVFIDTYGVDSYTGGTVIPALKVNGLSNIDPLAIIKIDVTPSGTPLNIREYLIGAKSTNQSSGGGRGIDGIPRVLNTAKPIVLKITNQETVNVNVEIGLVWYEI